MSKRTAPVKSNKQPANKRKKWIILIAVGVILSLLIAAYFLFIYVSDEDQIRERIELFTTAANEQDAKAYQECLVSSNRGLVSLSPKTPKATIEILSIEVDDIYAVAKVKVKAGDEELTSNYYLEEEEGEWYIDVIKMVGDVQKTN